MLYIIENIHTVAAIVYTAISSTPSTADSLQILIFSDSYSRIIASYFIQSWHRRVKNGTASMF